VEKQDAKFNVKLDVQVQNLPNCSNIFACNFASTFFMEIWKGPIDQCVKVYESELFVDEFSRDFCIQLTDAELCNCDKNLPIQFRFINRN
jgi:hypothetical protein